MTRKIAIVFIILLITLPLSAQQRPYPVFETDKIPAAEHKQRREKLMQQMGPGTLGVFFTNPEHVRNNDTDFMFRGDSGFLYLTGFEEPDAALALIPDGAELNGKRVREVLFCNVPESFSETWLGYRMGSDNAMRLLGIELVLPNSQFDKVFPRLAEAATGKRLTTGIIPTETAGRSGLARMVKTFQTWRESSGFENGPNGRQLLNQMRAIKSPAEVALLKKAAEISARAHVELIRSAEPGMHEWEIGALARYLFMREGCEYEGYPPICGSGPNGTILHYDSNRGPLKAGDVMVVDAAGEYHGYSADVTRSFPIGGKFTKDQRAIYDIVYRAQEAGIKQCRPGVSMRNVGNAAAEILAKGLMDLGIVKNREELRRYYMHGIGHGIGLDVHDPAPPTLLPGAVVTVEPGIYIKDGSPCDPKWWNIGVRIEDDILVTQNGPVNLSAYCPRTAEAIEKLMVEKGLGNIPLKPLKP